MRRFTNICFVWLWVFLSLCPFTRAQEPTKLSFSQQLFGLAQYGHAYDHSFWMDGRYIPQVNFERPTGGKGLFDIEVSGNFYGSAGTLGGNWSSQGKIRPYRAWLRYSNDRMELRAGLQKINFGSAQLLRPLMWFDSLDPRDPLQFTEGVWGGLFRYYFKNNANLWFWALTGNNKRKGWEMTTNTKRFSPEFGGRFQMSVPSGETAVTLHYRESTFIPSSDQGIETGEFRVGLDTKVDVGVGLCLETTYQRMLKDVGPLNNQLAITGGIDYTFGLGNGLGANLEHMFYTFGDSHFNKEYRYNSTALMMNYPIGLSDMLLLIGMYEWEKQDGHLFVGWKREMDHVSINLNAFWNPKQASSNQLYDQNRMQGVGLQLIIIWNHYLEKLW